MARAVVFDVGGVLAPDVWEHMLADPNGIISRYRVDEKLARGVGKKLWDDFACRSAQSGSGWMGLETKYWQEFMNQTNFTASVDELIDLTNKFIRPIPGMGVLLDRLRSSGAILAICSDNTEFWFRRQVSRLGLDEFFTPDRRILSYKVGVQKSSPNHEMFLTTLQALHVDRNACIFVDDRVANIERAVEFGVRSILFPSDSAVGSEYLNALLYKPSPERKLTSPIDIMLKEYESVRQESLTTLTLRTRILALGVPAIMTVFALGISVLTGSRESRADYSTLARGVLIIGIPLLVTGVLSAWWGEYRRMHRAGKHIAGLEKKINERAGQELLSWEKTTGHMQWPYLITILMLLLISSLSISVGLFSPNIASLKSISSLVPWYVACAVVFVFHIVIFVLILLGIYRAQRR